MTNRPSVNVVITDEKRQKTKQIIRPCLKNYSYVQYKETVAVFTPSKSKPFTSHNDRTIISRVAAVLSRRNNVSARKQ